MQKDDEQSVQQQPREQPREPAQQPQTNIPNPVNIANNAKKGINATRKGIKTARNIYNTAKKARAAVQAVQTAAAAFNPWVIVVVIVVVILIIIIYFFFKPDSDDNEFLPQEETPPAGAPGTTTVPNIPGFSLSVSAPQSVNNKQDIVYTVTFTYSPTTATVPLENIEIFSSIPANATFKGSTGEAKNTADNPMVWSLAVAENKNGFSITLSPSNDDVFVDYTVSARVIGGGGASSGTGNLSALLPATTESNTAIDGQMRAVVERIKSQPQLVSAYQAAEQATGMPWQILAGIHYREGSLNPNGSLVSGRPIGQNEPDIVAGGGCSDSPAPGKPVPLAGGGCGFNTFADSAIYAANHLRDKVGGIPSSFETLVTALSRYNGGGNSNCGEGVPYNFCPKDFYGEDDPYAMNLFDVKHQQMYVIFCADYTRCSPPRLDANLGTASVILALSKYYNEL